MNVLYLNTEDLTRDVSSGRVHFWAICHELRELGANVTIIAPRYRCRPLRPFVNVRCLGIPVPFKNFISLLLFECALLVLVPLIVLRFRPHALLVRGGGPGIAIGLVFLFFRLFGVRVVLECNGITWDEFRERHYSRFVTSIVRFGAMQQAAFCHHIIGVTQEIADAYCDLANRSRTHGTEIANGVYPEDFTFTQDERRKAREDRNIASSQFVVGYVGAFSVWHAIPLIIDAAQILHAKYGSKICFALVGDGDDLMVAKARKQDLGLENLLLPGAALSRDDLQQWMSCFDLGLCINLPTHRSPLKYFECLARGIPVIGSGAPQLQRMIESDHTGLYLPQLSDAALADAIEQIYLAPETWRVVGEHNQRLAREQHTWRQVAERVYAVLQR